MTRRLRGLLLVGFVASLSCGERLVEGETDERRHYCTPIVAYIEEPGGERFRLLNSETGVTQDWWCFCAEAADVDEEFREWANEEGYQACLAFVEREGYNVEHSDCQENYETGLFGAAYGQNRYDIDAEAPYCDELDESVGCAVR